MAASLAIKNIKNLVPLLDRVLVQRLKVEEKTASGLFLPSSAAAPPPAGTVLAVGPGARDRDGKLVEMSLKAGDKVLLPAFGGAGVKVGDEEYQIFRDAEILAKINE